MSPSAGLSRSDPPGIAATRALPCALLALALVLAAGCATSRRPEPPSPPGSGAIALRHADARVVADALNDLLERARRKARVGACVLYRPGLQPTTSSPPVRFAARDARTLLVYAPEGDGADLARVRELVARLDVPSRDG